MSLMGLQNMYKVIFVYKHVQVYRHRVYHDIYYTPSQWGHVSCRKKLGMIGLALLCVTNKQSDKQSKESKEK